MSKWKKTGFILIALLLLSFTIPVLWDRVTSSRSLSLFQWNLLLPNFLHQYLFWFAAALTILLVIGILVIIFYPKDKTTFVLKDGDDTLKIQKKAIEGLVDSHLNQRDFVKKPRIQIKAVKNKMKIRIKGELARTSDLVHRMESFTTEIKNDITNLLGHGKNYMVQVDFSKVEPKEEKVSRVQ